VCDSVFEKIAETRSEAVDAMTRLAQRSGAITGLYQSIDACYFSSHGNFYMQRHWREDS